MIQNGVIVAVPVSGPVIGPVPRGSINVCGYIIFVLTGLFLILGLSLALARINAGGALFVIGIIFSFFACCVCGGVRCFRNPYVQPPYVNGPVVRASPYPVAYPNNAYPYANPNNGNPGNMQMYNQGAMPPNQPVYGYPNANPNNNPNMYNNNGYPPAGQGQYIQVQAAPQYNNNNPNIINNPPGGHYNYQNQSTQPQSQPPAYSSPPEGQSNPPSQPSDPVVTVNNGASNASDPVAVSSGFQFNDAVKPQPQGTNNASE